eukprot:6179305-Pleurochrysis_carterae.AAC.3
MIAIRVRHHMYLNMGTAILFFYSGRQTNHPVEAAKRGSAQVISGPEMRRSSPRCKIRYVQMLY